MPRQLWLLRHGDAEPHGTRPDATRELTERGRRQAELAGVALAGIGLNFEALYTSPRTRALETARLVGESLGVELVVHEPLHAGFDYAGAEELLAGADADGRVLIVGHEPDFSQLVHFYTGARIDMKKGGIAAVRIEPGGGELFVLLRPREIELIAGGG